MSTGAGIGSGANSPLIRIPDFTPLQRKSFLRFCIYPVPSPRPYTPWFYPNPKKYFLRLTIYPLHLPHQPPYPHHPHMQSGPGTNECKVYAWLPAPPWRNLSSSVPPVSSYPFQDVVFDTRWSSRSLDCSLHPEHPEHPSRGKPTPGGESQMGMTCNQIKISHTIKYHSWGPISLHPSEFTSLLPVCGSPA